MVKTCSKCGVEKEDSEFHKIKANKLSIACKSCTYKGRAWRHDKVRSKEIKYTNSLNNEIKGDESLYCDTEFLEKLFSKKLKKSNECA